MKKLLTSTVLAAALAVVGSASFAEETWIQIEGWNLIENTGCETPGSGTPCVYLVSGTAFDKQTFDPFHVNPAFVEITNPGVKNFVDENGKMTHNVVVVLKNRT